MSDNIGPIEKGNLSSRIYSELREALIAGRFQPGERLHIQETADKLGTSVTPVREALLRLVSERGLEMQAARSISVPQMTLERYMESRAIRMSLERLAAEIATEHIPETEIDVLEKLHHKFVAAEKKHKQTEAMNFNREFHFGIYRWSKMPMLIATIESMWVAFGPFLNVFYKNIATDYTGAEEHMKAVAALRKRDAKAAGLAMQNDIVRAGKSIIDYLESEAQEASAS